MDKERLYQKYLYLKRKLDKVSFLERRYLLSDLYGLKELLEINNLDSELTIYEEFSKEILDLFLNGYYISKEYYQELFSNVVILYSKLYFPVTNINENSLKRLSKEEEKEILSSFLKEYNINIYTLYKVILLKKNIIYDSSLKNSDCYYFGNLKEGIIRLKYEKRTLSMLSSLIHELGHIYESSLQEEKAIYYSFASPLYEVSSNYLEFLFLNYLVDNKIYLKDSEILLLEYFNTLYGHCFDSLVNTFFSKNSLVGSTYVLRPSYLEKHSIKKEFENRFGIVPNLRKREYSLDNSLVHAFGGLIGISLVDKYYQDKKNRLKIENFFKDYPFREDILYNELCPKMDLLNNKTLIKYLTKMI